MRIEKSEILAGVYRTADDAVHPRHRVNDIVSFVVLVNNPAEHIEKEIYVFFIVVTAETRTHHSGKHRIVATGRAFHSFFFRSDVQEFSHVRLSTKVSIPHSDSS